MGQNRDLSKFPNAITVLDNGNVGIGNTNPGSRFDVRVASGDSNQMRISADSSTYKDMQWYDTTNGRMWIWSHRVGSDGNKLMAWYNNGTSYNTNPAITIDTSNNIGVNTSSPSRTFDARGFANLSTTTPSVSGSGYADIHLRTYAGAVNSPAKIQVVDNWTDFYTTYTDGFRFKNYSSDGVQRILYGVGASGSIYAAGNIRPGDQGYGGIDFYSNGFGYAYSTKFYTFKSPDQSEMYGFTNDYGSGTAAELAMVAKQSSIGNIGFYTGTSTTAKMRINVNGQITKPYQPAFYAWYNGGASTRTTGEFTSFNLTRVNRGSHYNTSNGRFTAPVSGVYEFIFSLLWRQSGSGGSGEISIGLNGANINGRGMGYSMSLAGGDYHNQTIVRAILNLSAGDYVTGWVHSSGDGSANWYYGDNLGHFSGHLLG